MHATKEITFTAVLAAVPALATAAPTATPFAADNGLLIEYETGSGDADAYFVVDFDATSGNSYAFALAFDPDGPTLTGYDLLERIADAGPLDFTATDFGDPGQPNFFIDNVSYLSDTGDADQFFAQWEGFVVGNEVSWEIGDGISNVDLVDGLVVGVRNPFSFTDEPDAPFIPEPASLLILGVGAAAVLMRRTGGMG